MSLHQLAHHVQSAGRGEDKVLVHMTPKEVSGLQALAMAHGGSLTINPETGLPEAGFLSSLLPMLAGGALTIMSGGALSPLMAAGLVGGGTALATGSLQKGLMAGLGAYGGAGLGAGLSSMGATQAAQQAYAPQAAQWAEVSKNIQNFNPAAAATTTTATGAPAQVFTAATPTGLSGGLPPDILRGGAGFGGAGAPSTIASTVPAAPAAPIADFSKITPELGGMKAFPTQAAPTAVNFSNYQPALGGLDRITPGLSEAPSALDKLSMGAKQATSGVQGLKDLYAASEAAAPYSGVASLGSLALGAMDDKKKMPATDTGMIRPYTYERTQIPGAYDMGEPIYSATPGSSAEKTYFTDKYTALAPYKAPGPEYAAAGGIMGLAVGGPVEQMSAMNAVGDNQMYPQSQLQTPLYSNPAVQRPEAVNVISPSAQPAVGMYSGEPKFAGGGISHLGDYSDGGRLLKGPGDGVSDSIPAVIGKRQPARLADGEFVVPARIVSELGNGSTEAGARKLYAMMDRVQKARRKTVGKNRVAANTKSEKYLPA